MTSNDLRRPLLVALLAAACGGGGSSSPTVPSVFTPTVVGAVPTGPNVVPVSLSGTCGSAGGYFNEPCVSATVCVPGTTTCQTVDGLLLDTGSTGLRVFSQVLGALGDALPRVTLSGATVGECIAYLDGANHWGPVVLANVVLGGEPAVEVPIQIIDAGFSAPPSACAGAQASPAAAGFNGILGVAIDVQDCGPACEPTAANGGSLPNGPYFACGASCTGIALPVASQVTNPVAALPTDGNGVLVKLPAVPAAGAGSASGALVLGIGTRANNTPPPSVLAVPLDPAGELRTTLGGSTTAGFLDTGSNGLFFPSSSLPSTSLPACPSPNGSWFCPASPVTLSATNAGWQGSPSEALLFRISSLDAVDARANVASEVAGLAPGPSGVDWGLPFHLGRDVYVGFEGRSSSLGTGPFVAY